MPPDLHAVLDTAFVPAARLLEVARALLAGGAGVLQLRAKDETTPWRADTLHALAPLCAHAGVPLVCNDDVEAALAVPGVGLHVGQDDLGPSLARVALGPDRVLGISTHSFAQARAAAMQGPVLTYFAVGPVFATPTKPDYPAVGLELVRAVAEIEPALPWFCIGGINRKNISTVRAAGARAVVAVSDVLRDPDPAGAVRAFRAALEK
jgi:thiamine-phosphate pyrophosphorylase